MLRRLMMTGGVGGDPDFASVVTLLHFDGADASTTVTDVKGRVWTPQGNAQLDTAQSKFGGSSLLLDGNGDMVRTANSSDLNLPGQFTVEAWIRLVVNNVAQGIFQRYSQGGGAGNGGLGFGLTSGGKMQVSVAGTSVVLTATTTVTTGTWHHVACTRDASNNVRVWLDGVQDGTAVSSAAFTESLAGTAGIGGYWNGTTVSEALNGWMDDVRITKGVCRYTGTFTPPTAAFPDS
jgi:hypothetical protein